MAPNTYALTEPGVKAILARLQDPAQLNVEIASIAAAVTAADEKASVGNILGPGVSSDKVADAIEAIIDTYIASRCEGEQFIDTYRRLGAAPFKEAVYGAA